MSDKKIAIKASKLLLVFEDKFVDVNYQKDISEQFYNSLRADLSL